MLHYHDSLETPKAKILRYCIGPLAVNTFIIICKETHEAAVMDPGGEVPALLAAIKEEKARVTHIIFTHAHIDHIYGAQELHEAIPEAKIACHGLEAEVIKAIPKMCRMFGMELRKMPPIDIDLQKTPEFFVGRLQLRSILTPGHTPGSVCYYFPEEKLGFTGDLLFRNGVGRTDFEGGSGSDLRKSLDHILEYFPDDTQILPGHGRFTMMGVERENNYYLRIDSWR